MKGVPAQPAVAASAIDCQIQRMHCSSNTGFVIEVWELAEGYRFVSLFLIV